MAWAFPLAAVLLIVGFTFELLRPIDKRWSSFGKYRLPPGPKGSFIVGNMLDFWNSRSASTTGSMFLSLREYGEMATLHMGGTLWVVLNTNRVTDEIIGKRAKLTHERPHMPISGNLVSKGMRSVTQPTRIWSELRRMMRPLLNDTWTKRFIEWQDIESIHMLHSYIQDPSTWYLHNSRYATGVMHGIIAGSRLTKTEADMQTYRKTTMEFLNSIFSTTIDFFPWLEYLPSPLQFWRQKWTKMGQSHYEVFKSWWEPIKHHNSHEKSSTSWTKNVVLNPDSNFKGNEDEALYLTNTVISAGGDNPRIALNTCLMACLSHPRAYQKCREEIDRICTSPESLPRLPTVRDIPSLPFTSAFIKECLRWRPVVPMVPPHTSSETFTFEDCIFPKGTNFIINVPATSLDYDNAYVFDPERWIDEMGNEAKLTHKFWGFGGGRRVCIGYKAAQTGLFLPFARLVMCFELGKDGEFDDSKVNPWCSDEPFPLKIVVRSEAHRQLIIDEPLREGLNE